MPAQHSLQLQLGQPALPTDSTQYPLTGTPLAGKTHCPSLPCIALASVHMLDIDLETPHKGNIPFCLHWFLTLPLNLCFYCEAYIGPQAVG